MKYKFNLTKNFIISKIKKLHYKLNFSITNKCNSKCITCNIWKCKDYKNELTLLEIKKILRSFPSTLSWLSLTGGEPFLRDDLYDIISVACKEMPNLRLISIPSNGLAQNKILSEVKKMLNLKINLYITFSLDGPPKIHNKIRGVKNAFEKTWDTYIKVKNLTKENGNIKIGLETTISDKNVDYLIPFIKKLGNHELIISIAHNAYFYKNTNDKKLLSYCNIGKIKKIIAASKQYNLINFECLIKRSYLKKIPIYLKNRSKVMPCTALKNSVAIDSCGKVTPCPMWGFVIGDLRKCNYDIMSLWHSKKAETARKLIEENKCCNCWTPCEAYQSIIYNLI